MASRILSNSGEEIEKTLSTGYVALVVRGIGLVRDTGVQNISGVKNFYDRISFNSGLYVTGDLAVTGDIVGNLIPKFDDFYDLGTSNLQWRNIFINGTGRIDSLHVDENASISGSLIAYSGITASGGLNISGNSNFFGSTVVNGTLGVSSNAIVSGTLTSSGNFTSLGDFIPTNFAANFIPKTDNAYDIASPTVEIRNIYVDGTGQIDYLKVDENAVVISGLSVGNGLTVTGSSSSTSFDQAASYRTTGSGSFGTLYITGTGIPTLATSAGVAGQVVWGSGYLFVCTGSNRWGRTLLSTW